jgi:hypothetical protein
VRVIREKHPLQGQNLEVLGHQHRLGVLYLVLAMPDSGTSMIPAAWTDFGISIAPQAESKHQCRTLASVTELIRTRTVVDALLSRLDSEHPHPATKEGPHAAGASADAPEVATSLEGLAKTKRSATDRTHRSHRSADEKNDPDGDEEKSR